MTVQSQGVFDLFLDLLSGHRLFNGHRLIDIDGNLGLGQIGQIGLVDLGVDEDIGRLTLLTGLNVTRKLGELAIGQTPKNSGSDGHSLDIGIEDLKILEGEGPIQNQSQILSRPSNLTDSLGGGVDGGNVIDVIHYGDKSTMVCGGIKLFSLDF